MRSVVAPDTLRVLVVDDEMSILSFAERALRDAGYEVVVASDGPEALRIVEAQAPFDVFVIDILMPTMRGDELARWIRQADPNAKVLYFTGHSDRLVEDRKVLWQNEAFSGGHCGVPSIARTPCRLKGSGNG